MGTLRNLLRALDANPQTRGRQFERICKWFLLNDPAHSQLRQVWLWDDWPGRWGADAGIDLVAEDGSGHLWAVQAKAYSEHTSITKHDVDSFLSESGRAQFSYRLLIATTDRIGATAKRTVEGQEKQASVLLLGDLEDAELDWPTSPDDLQASRLPRRTPRPHQQEAIDSVKEGFDRTDRGQLIMACGTGKTLTALFIAEVLAAERTLVLVPSLTLLSQTVREWTATSSTGFDFLPVCSDDTVSELDGVVGTTSDLGYPVTTDPVEIAKFLSSDTGPRVVFATYQSSPQVATAFSQEDVPGFDLAIADEAHRCAGHISTDFGTILDRAAIPARRRLFMTATPRYFTGRVVREASDADLEVASMDDARLFGPVFHRLSFGEAIERNLLTDYRVAIVGVDNTTYQQWATSGRFVTRDGGEVESASVLASQIGLAKAMRCFDLRRTISFHSRVKRARDFAESLPGVIEWMPEEHRPQGGLWSAYASGEMPAGQRHTLIRQLAHRHRAERALLANARCLAEGVDVPALDGVAFIDPRRSEVDIVQAVGRAIRLAPDKTVGTIVIPVFVESDTDPDIALGRSTFQPVWDVIKALRSHDDELGEHIDSLRRQLGRTGASVRLPDKIVLDLPASVGADFADAFDVRLVELTSTTWEFWFGLLQQYIDQHANAAVPGSYEVNGYRLGRWIIKQRTKRDMDTLLPDRRERLQDLPGWTWDPKVDQWEESYARLLKYVEDHGDSRLTASYMDADFPLGRWVIKQRARRTEDNLSAERQQRLEALPGWRWDNHSSAWDEGFDHLQRYEASHGHTRIPAAYKVDDYRLGQWVTIQRQNRTKGTLEETRVQRLQDLPNWTWDPIADMWEEGFRLLTKYVAQQGDSRVPQQYKLDNYALGSWVNGQRANRRSGKLTAERQHRLESLPGWTWDPRADRWEEGFRHLSLYVEREGTAAVLQTHKEGRYPLGPWVATQRTAYREGVLDAERVKRLQAQPGWTWAFVDDSWEEGFSRLQAFVDEVGNARVPRDFKTEEGYNLGQWVISQRQRHAKNGGDPDRERRLVALNGWSWDPQSDQWEEGYTTLLQYLARPGNAGITKSTVEDGYPLGAWVMRQRAMNTRGTIDPERHRRLEAVPGWTWDPFADQWEAAFNALQRYVDEHGDALVPSTYEAGELKLGRWVVTQRRNHLKGTISAAREQRLTTMPGWTWSTRS